MRSFGGAGSDSAAGAPAPSGTGAPAAGVPAEAAVAGAAAAPADEPTWPRARQVQPEHIFREDRSQLTATGRDTYASSSVVMGRRASSDRADSEAAISLAVGRSVSRRRPDRTAGSPLQAGGTKFDQRRWHVQEKKVSGAPGARPGAAPRLK